MLHVLATLPEHPESVPINALVTVGGNLLAEDATVVGGQLLVRGIIVPFRANSSTKLYKMLWTDEGSPLKFYGERVVAGL